jgi:hypothetical protein
VVGYVVEHPTEDEEVGTFIYRPGNQEKVLVDEVWKIWVYITYGPARRSTVLAINTPIFPHCPKAPTARRMKPAVNRRADHGRRPVTFHDLYLL